ncbi:MAG: type III toxin-antitoxin system ToxN/AbiQ family toxin [Lachnospiraceae bacterium]|nr:type III toxin-antitoxin system ToxN/AbiQ family toxin [Lachnospiraceae bacterium]
MSFLVSLFLCTEEEWNFCVDNIERIQKKANKIYEMVTQNRKQILTDNSCDFKLLEKAYMKYIAQQ